MELHISRKKCNLDYLKAFKKAFKNYRRIFFDWVLLYNMAKLISEKVSFNNFNNVFPTPFLHPILICFSDKTCLKKRAPSSMVLESRDSTNVWGRSQWFIISKIGHLFFSILSHYASMYLVSSQVRSFCDCSNKIVSTNRDFMKIMMITGFQVSKRRKKIWDHHTLKFVKLQTGSQSIFVCNSFFLYMFLFLWPRI